MPHSDQSPKVTVEDLIRLKRAERPAPEFWTTFERELRQKQLTALLEKRPWWQELPQFFARRAYLPVGATAILAFSLVTVRYYTPSQLPQVEPAATDALSSIKRSVAVAAPTAAPVTSPTINRSKDRASVSDENTVVAETVAPTRVSASAGQSAPAAPSTQAESPSSRFFATNLDRLEKTDPELVQAVMGSRLSAPARVQTASLPFNELASVPTNMTRRSRILAQYTDRPLTPEPSAPEIVRERLARRLGDSDITDRISRIGLKGDQISLGLTLRL